MTDTTASISDDTPLGAAALSKLKWRCRRGLLENDLFIERFFNKHGSQLTLANAFGMEQLMDLSDNDLLDLLLKRTQPQGHLLDSRIVQVLSMLHAH
jgi:antitoxin CptB